MSRGSIRSRYVYRNVRNVPVHIKQAVAEEAVERGCTMSDVIGMVLAERFGGQYVMSGERSIGVDLDGDQFRIQLPVTFGEKIWKQSRKTGETESSVVLRTLADHFGVPFERVKRGRKRAAA